MVQYSVNIFLGGTNSKFTFKVQFFCSVELFQQVQNIPLMLAYDSSFGYFWGTNSKCSKNFLLSFHLVQNNHRTFF